MRCKFLRTMCVHIMIFCALWLVVWPHIERDSYTNVCSCFSSLFTSLSTLHTALICCFYEYLHPTFTQTTAIFASRLSLFRIGTSYSKCSAFCNTYTRTLTLFYYTYFILSCDKNVSSQENIDK
jgi:hypothetical protein